MPTPTSQLTNEEIRAYSKEHLHYEISMLQQVSSFDLSATPTHQRQFAENILLASFAIHLRNLITFLYPTTFVKNTDVYAWNFFNERKDWESICSPSSISSTLNEARDRAHREVGHLTTYRIAGIPDYKKWEVAALRHEIEGVLKLFVRAAEKEKLDTSIAELLP